MISGSCGAIMANTVRKSAARKKKKKMEEKHQRKLEKSGNQPSENPEPSLDQSDTVTKDE